MSDSEHPSSISCSRYPVDTAAEYAALFAVDALSGDEMIDFDAHLKSGCEFCTAELLKNQEALAAEIFVAKPLRPSATLRSELLAEVAEAEGRAQNSGHSSADHSDSIQLFKNWRRKSPLGEFYILREGDGDWLEATPGVRFKQLSVDVERRYVTMLVSMDAGASYPPHHHAGSEECYVLHGDLHVGGEVLGPGDYQHAGPGSKHGVQSTEKGCTLLIVSSQDDHLL